MASKPLVSARWLDAHGEGTNAYAEHEIPHAAIEVTTYGLLLRQDAAGISLASEWCADNTYRGVTFIPAAMLLDLKPLVPVRKARVKKPVIVVEEP